MQNIRSSLLRHVNINVLPLPRWSLVENTNAGLTVITRRLCASSNSHDEIMARVLGLVKKFDKIDACKVTEKADFQKDLSLDSLDRTELVMAFEEEFSVEIPEDKAEKLTCCADVANYITSEPRGKVSGSDK